MNETIGKRIAELRKSKGLTQEDLADRLNVSGQAVSKWENDQTCPDISLLPQLSRVLGVSTDELLSGKQAQEAAVRMLPEEERKSTGERVLRIIVNSADGDRVRVNLPLQLIKTAMDCGLEPPRISGNSALEQVNWEQVMAILEQGVIGDLVEVESSDGDVIQIRVE